MDSCSVLKWCKDVEELNSKHFNTLLRTFQNNYAIITNYFLHRATNAAESFNAKIKEFRRQFRGVRDVFFFLSSFLD
ncbi:MAG: transposase [Bacteroidales bacterium]